MKSKTIDSCQVIIGGFLINFLLSGTTRLSPLLYVEFLNNFEIGREQASFPFVLCFLMRNISGPLIGYLEQIFGVKVVITVGCILSIVSIGACSFAENFSTVTILWGGLYGLGFGLACQLVPLHVTRSFQSNQGKANGFVYAGCCAGGILLPPIMLYLIQVYGVSGSFIILSAIISHSIPAVLILKEGRQTAIRSSEGTFSQENNLKTEISNLDDLLSEKSGKCMISIDSSENTNERIADSHFENNTTECDNQSTTFPFKQISKMQHSGEKYDNFVTNEKSPTPQKKNFENDDLRKNFKIFEVPTESSLPSSDRYMNKNTDMSLNCLSRKLKRNKVFEQLTNNKKYSLKNFAIFIDPVFLAFTIVNTCDLFAVLTFTTVILDYARDKGVPHNYEVYCLMAIPFADFIGRCVSGFIIDKISFCITKLSAICFICTIISYFITVIAKDITMILLGEILIGLFYGIIVIINILLVENFFEEDKKSMAMSCRFLMQVPVSFGISPMIGHFREKLGSYDPVMYVLSGTSLISVFAVYSIPYLRKRRKGQQVYE